MITQAIKYLSDNIWSSYSEQSCPITITEKTHSYVVNKRSRSGISLCEFTSESWLTNLDENTKLKIYQFIDKNVGLRAKHDICQGQIFDNYSILTNKKGQWETKSLSSAPLKNSQIYYISRKGLWDNLNNTLRKSSGFQKDINAELIFTCSSAGRVDRFVQDSERFDIIDDLKSVFTFVNPDRIYLYLMANYNYVKLVKDIAANIRRYIETNDNLTIEVLDDPEDSYNEFIRIKIITDSNSSNTFDNLESFYIKWYFVFVETYRYNISFDIGYK
jgi:hypothetical protein